jgi:WD40 repeat protein
VKTGKQVGAPLPPVEEGRGLAAFSRDGRILATTGPMGGKVRLWDAARGKLLRSLSANASSVQCLVFSSDGKTLATADLALELWDVATGKPRAAVRADQGQIRAVTFSPDGECVLTAWWGGTARLWDASTGEPLGPLMPHAEVADAVAFSPDGKLVALGYRDHTVRLWVRATSKPFSAPLEHDGPVTTLAFSPDGKALLVGCGPSGEKSSGEARLWHLPAPLTGDPDRIDRDLQVRTGMELDRSGVGRVLDAATWRQRRGR